MSRQPRQGHGRWSHTDLLLADILDRLGHLGYAQGAYKNPPDPYARPGIAPPRRINPAAVEYLQKLVERQGATEKPMTAGLPGTG